MFPAQFQTVSVGGLAQPGLVTLQHHQSIQPQGIHNTAWPVFRFTRNASY